MAHNVADILSEITTFLLMAGLVGEDEQPNEAWFEALGVGADLPWKSWS